MTDHPADDPHSDEGTAERLTATIALLAAYRTGDEDAFGNVLETSTSGEQGLILYTLVQLASRWLDWAFAGTDLDPDEALARVAHEANHHR